MLPRASPQPCPLLGSWQACLFSSYGLPKATLGILARLQTLPRASPQPCPLLGRLPKATFRHFKPPSKAFRPLAASLWPVRSFSAAGRPLAASLPPLFLWASEGNVRHFGPASKASRQPAGLLRPLCGLSEACLLSSYGLPKATLGILDRLQKPLASRQPAGLLRPLCGLSEACLLSSYGLPKATLGIWLGFKRSPEPHRSLALFSAAGRPASLLSSYGLPKATLGVLARLQRLPRASPQPCPLLGRLPKATFRHFGPPSQAFRLSEASRQPAGLLRPLCGLSEACLLSSFGLPKAT